MKSQRGLGGIAVERSRDAITFRNWSRLDAPRVSTLFACQWQQTNRRVRSAERPAVGVRPETSQVLFCRRRVRKHWFCEWTSLVRDSVPHQSPVIAAVLLYAHALG
jgi:hypothetical protein